MAKIYGFQRPNLYVGSVCAHRIAIDRGERIDANHALVVRETNSREEAHESALVSATRLWPQTEDWTGHDVQMVPVTQDVLSQLLVNKVFMTSIQAVKETENPHQLVEHRHGIFLVSAEDLRGALSLGNIKIKADCPPSNGWILHGSIAHELSQKRILTALRSLEIAIH